MNTENQLPVQPELLWVDEKNLKIEQIRVVTATTALNRFILECEKILKGILSDEYKIELKDRKVAALMEEVKKKFPFPDATEEFNLQSLGIDLTAAKQYANDHTNSWSGIEFELDEQGLFVALEDQEIYEHYKNYANSERRKKALEIARKLIELSEEAREFYLLDTMHLRSLGHVFRNIVRIDLKSDRSNEKIEVYNEAIANTIR